MFAAVLQAAAGAIAVAASAADEELAVEPSAPRAVASSPVVAALIGAVARHAFLGLFAAVVSVAADPASAAVLAYAAVESEIDCSGRVRE